jgi:lysophospholipase L1-like esterase
MKTVKFLQVIILFFSLFGKELLHAQQLPFWNEIRSFKKQDQTSPPPKNAILFVGSSSFNYWKDVGDYFPGYTIINRGFGGSTLVDVIRYAPDVIYPYKPKQVVIYCGENDLASSDTVSPALVLSRFKTLFNAIRANVDKVNIAFVSIKPSPSRFNLMPKMVETNRLIKDFLCREKNTAYINVFDKMLINGKPRGEMFREDSLHMTAKGYAVWAPAIKQYLLK